MWVLLGRPWQRSKLASLFVPVKMKAYDGKQARTTILQWLPAHANWHIFFWPWAILVNDTWQTPLAFFVKSRQRMVFKHTPAQNGCGLRKLTYIMCVRHQFLQLILWRFKFDVAQGQKGLQLGGIKVSLSSLPPALSWYQICPGLVIAPQHCRTNVAAPWVCYWLLLSALVVVSPQRRGLNLDWPHWTCLRERDVSYFQFYHSKF